MISWWINNSQEYKSFEIDAVTFKISITEYYHLINHQAYGLFQNSNVTMGQNEYGNSCHLSIFTFLTFLMMRLKCFFSGLHFENLIKDTDNM